VNLKGRPSAYRPDLYPTLASYWAQDGLTESQMAERIGVAMSTFSLWKTKYPEFSVALKTSKDEADSKVVESLYHQALKGNVTAQIFWLKNRQPAKWRDRQEVETTQVTDIALAVKRIVDA
jgi:transposase